MCLCCWLFTMLIIFVLTYIRNGVFVCLSLVYSVCLYHCLLVYVRACV